MSKVMRAFFICFKSKMTILGRNFWFAIKQNISSESAKFISSQNSAHFYSISVKTLRKTNQFSLFWRSFLENVWPLQKPLHCCPLLSYNHISFSWFFHDIVKQFEVFFARLLSFGVCLVPCFFRICFWKTVLKGIQ